MRSEPTDFARHLSRYFLRHLSGSRNLSENTIASRRTTFALLIEYCSAVEGIGVATLEVADIDRTLVERFLSWLERDRGNSASTRNIRLDAVKTFFSYLQTVAPEHLLQCQQVLSIPRKKEPKPCVRWLALEEVRSLLAGIDSSRYQGLRDLALLSLLYDSAARVSELADAKVRDLRTEPPARIRLVGKGTKERYVPLMSATADVMAEYLRRRAARTPLCDDDHLFVNRSGTRLSRGGISHILRRHWEAVPPEQRDVGRPAVTPHVLRHSRAVHLLQADVPLIYIRDFLGHSELATTEMYAQCDTGAVRKAIERGNKVKVDVEDPVWERDPSLLRWLESLSG
jgi:site-specific recombinase XerD